MRDKNEFGSILDFKSLECIYNIISKLEETESKKVKNISRFINLFNFKYSCLMNSSVKRSEKIYFLELLLNDFIQKTYDKSGLYDEILLSHIRNFFKTKIKIVKEQYIKSLKVNDK